MLLKSSFLALIFLFISSCSGRNTVQSFTFTGMGTLLTVTYTGQKNIAVESEIKQSVENFEKQVSYYKKGSLVSQFNRLKKESELLVPHWFCELVAISLHLGVETDNAFDITYKAKGKLWDSKSETPPTDEELRRLSTLVGADLVISDCKRNMLKKKRDAVVIDLGGVAKGYAIDSVGDLLKEHKITNFIVNFGGDMLVCGNKNGKKWKIGIKNPLKPGDFLKVISADKMSCTAMATSGDYERFVVKNGKKYSHIIDPKTGNPVDNAKSVTVIGKRATVVDLLATAISVNVEKSHFIKKIIASFGVAVYTLSGMPPKWQTFEPRERPTTHTEGR
ncbi:FAD:protein FMN transferase [bacterium]|nr:FAD:protein FMN transferase [bacterium]